jgi:K+ transporter
MFFAYRSKSGSKRFGGAKVRRGKLARENVPQTGRPGFHEFVGLNRRPTAAAADTSYYVGHETIVVKDEARLNRIPEAIFSYMNRNAVHEEKRFGMPLAQVVEIGTQIDI